MEVVCPALPALETLPFAHDRDAAWHMLLAPGEVAVSDSGVYFLSGADVVEAAATNPGVFSSQGAFDLVGSPFPMVPIAFDPICSQRRLATGATLSKSSSRRTCSTPIPPSPSSSPRQSKARSTSSIAVPSGAAGRDRTHRRFARPRRPRSSVCRRKSRRSRESGRRTTTWPTVWRRFPLAIAA